MRGTINIKKQSGILEGEVLYSTITEKCRAKWLTHVAVSKNPCVENLLYCTNTDAVVKEGESLNQKGL